ncbi:MAG: hypothetical protein NXI04_28370 [Planctomycetaceae bacterium]|nr:hypothetical protein [Planctomycetaceae bacterium]
MEYVPLGQGTAVELPADAIAAAQSQPHHEELYVSQWPYKRLCWAATTLMCHRHLVGSHPQWTICTMVGQAVGQLGAACRVDQYVPRVDFNHTLGSALGRVRLRTSPLVFTSSTQLGDQLQQVNFEEQVATIEVRWNSGSGRGQSERGTHAAVVIWRSDSTHAVYQVHDPLYGCISAITAAQLFEAYGLGGQAIDLDAVEPR